LKALDGRPYTTLSYSSGPSFYENIDEHGFRANLEAEDLNSKDFRFPSMIPLRIVSHSGEDVPLFASGPHAHLFSGVYEQNFIPHAIRYIACIGQDQHLCSEKNLK
jgi:alkaline phosphatase